MFTSLKLCTITPLGMCVPKKKLQQTKQNRETMQTIGKQRNKKNGCKLGMEFFPLQLHLHYRFKPNAVFFLL